MKSSLQHDFDGKPRTLINVRLLVDNVHNGTQNGVNNGYRCYSCWK